MGKSRFDSSVMTDGEQKGQPAADGGGGAFPRHRGRTTAFSSSDSAARQHGAGFLSVRRAPTLQRPDIRSRSEAEHPLEIRLHIDVSADKNNNPLNIQSTLNGPLESMANLPLVDTMHHALQTWCIVCVVHPDSPGQLGQCGTKCGVASQKTSLCLPCRFSVHLETFFRQIISGMFLSIVNLLGEF